MPIRVEVQYSDKPTQVMLWNKMKSKESISLAGATQVNRINLTEPLQQVSTQWFIDNIFSKQVENTPPMHLSMVKLKLNNMHSYMQIKGTNLHLTDSSGKDTSHPFELKKSLAWEENLLTKLNSATKLNDIPMEDILPHVYNFIDKYDYWYPADIILKLYAGYYAYILEQNRISVPPLQGSTPYDYVKLLSTRHNDVRKR